MFNFLARDRVPAGPHEFTAEIEIERPIADVYALIDFADARHAKRQLGEQVHHLAADRFVLVMGMMPDVRFDIAVTEAVGGAVYDFGCQSTPRMGRMESSRERYSFESLGDDLCRVQLDMTATFQTELRGREYQEEAVKVLLSAYNALARIKIHAEEGVEAARSVANVPLVGLEDLIGP